MTCHFFCVWSKLAWRYQKITLNVVDPVSIKSELWCCTIVPVFVAQKCNGGDSCCQFFGYKCGVGEGDTLWPIVFFLWFVLFLGDCGHDWDCKSGLKCGTNNCKAVNAALGRPTHSFELGDDCCYRFCVLCLTCFLYVFLFFHAQKMILT